MEETRIVRTVAQQFHNAGLHDVTVKLYENGRQISDDGTFLGEELRNYTIETDAKCDRGWVDADWIRVTK